MSPVKGWAEYIEEADSGPKPLEDGETYNFVINEPARAEKTGNDYPKFTVVAVVESGERANSRVYHSFSLSANPGANKRFFFDALAALGLDREFFKTNPTDEQISHALQGKRFTAKAVQNENNGKKYINLENIAPPAGGPVVGGGPATPTPQAAPAANPAPTPQQAQPQAPAAPQQPQPQAQPVQQEVQQPPQPQAQQPQQQAAPASDSPWTSPPPLPFQ